MRGNNQRNNNRNSQRQQQQQSQNQQPQQNTQESVEQEIRIGELANIAQLPEDIGGRMLNFRQIHDGVSAVLVGLSNLNPSDIYAVRTMKPTHPNQPPTIILQVHRNAIGSNRRAGSAFIQYSGGSNSGLMPEHMRRALEHVLVEDISEAAPRVVNFRQTELVEYRLNPSMVAAVLCDVAYDDSFLVVSELPDIAADSYGGNGRQMSKTCGLLIRYSYEGKDHGFSKESVINFVEQFRPQYRKNNQNQQYR